MRPGRTLPPAAAPVGRAALIAALRATSLGGSSSLPIENELAAYLRVRHTFLVSSGKAALTLLLQALKSLRPGRTVAIPAYTCFSVPAAVVKAGLRPLLVDIDPHTFDFEPASLARAFDDPNLLAIVPTHLFGIPADLARLRRMRRTGHAFIVEDATQALGVQSAEGRRLGCAGDASVFSLGRGKHLSAGGGGFIATGDEQIGRQVAALVAALPAPTMLGSLGHVAEMAAVETFINPCLYWLPAGLPFLGLGETVYSTDFEISRIDGACVGALTGWRARLDRANRARQRTCRAYVRELGVAVGAAWDLPLLRFPIVMGAAAHRSAVLETSADSGLGVSRMYPSAVHRIPELNAQFGSATYPGAETLAARLITLPTHEFVTGEDRRQLAAMLNESSRDAAPARPKVVPSW